ncbi:MAG: protein kinase [Myxococcota bacterium]
MSVAPDDDGLIGRVVLGRYRIIRRLAVGGMGVIYLARNEGAAGFIRPVVVKRILPEKMSQSAVTQGFAREARILSNLRHPGIVGIVDFREEDGAYLMILEYVHGFDLGRWHRFAVAQRGQLPVDLVVHVMLAMLDALHYAHTLVGPDGVPLDIVHRDISPSNLLLDVDGPIKLTDFGIARMQASSDEFRTEEGKIRGKFHYLAPELFGRAEPSACTDVFSAGVMLHELLAGTNEFRTEDVQATVARVLGHKLTPLTQLRPDVSAALSEVVERASAKRASERFQSAHEFAEALRETRTQDPTFVAERFRTVIQADFHAPEMSEVSGTEPLRVLEQAWQAPPIEAQHLLASGPAEQASEPPPPSSVELRGQSPTLVSPPRLGPSIHESTAMASVVVSTDLPQVPPPRRWPLLAGVGVILVVGAFAASRLLSPPPGPKYVLVQGQVSGDLAATPPPASPAPSASPSQSATAEPPSPSASPAPPDQSAAPRPPKEGPVEALTRAFAKNEPAVERCYREHAAEVDRAREVFLRFRVGAQGEVERAELLPPELASTPLGDCLLKVARAAKFPGQGAPLGFRIPLSVRGNQR